MQKDEIQEDEKEKDEKEEQEQEVLDCINVRPLHGTQRVESPNDQLSEAPAASSDGPYKYTRRSQGGPREEVKDKAAATTKRTRQQDLKSPNNQLSVALATSSGGSHQSTRQKKKNKTAAKGMKDKELHRS